MQTTIYNLAGNEVEKIDLDDTIFGITPNHAVIHQAVLRQQANARQGTHDTKTRAEVSGGGKKPWRQKGTGRARQGSTRAPHWRGGGVTFGHQPRSHSFSVNKKVRRAALMSALSRRVGEKALFVLDALSWSEPKTRNFRNFMKAFGVDSLLVVVPSEDRALTLASRNIPGVTVLPVGGLNVYDVLRHRNIALTQPAIAPIVERLSR